MLSLESETDGSSDEPSTLQHLIPRLQQDALRRRHESRLASPILKKTLSKWQTSFSVQNAPWQVYESPMPRASCLSAM